MQAFEVIRNARNTVLKRGNIIVRSVQERHYAEGPVPLLTVLENPASVQQGEILFDVRPEAERALTPLTDEFVVGLAQPEIDQIIREKVALMNDLAAKIRMEIAGKVYSRFEFVLWEPAKSFAEFVAEMSSYLAALDDVLDDADRVMSNHLGLPSHAV